MRIILQLLSKDLRRMGPAAGVFLLLQFATVAAAVWFLHFSPNPEDFTGPAPLWFMAAQVGSSVISYLLSVSLLREDPLFDSSTFWITRPISGLQLLISKACALALLVLLPPFLAAIPWWVGSGVGLPFMSSAANFIFGLQMSAIMLAWLSIFFLKRDSSLLLFLIMTIAILVCWMAFVSQVGNQARSMIRTLPYGVIETREALTRLMVVLTVLVSLILCYVFRKRRVALGLFAVAVVVSCLILTFWPWPLSRVSQGDLKRITLQKVCYQQNMVWFIPTVELEYAGLLENEVLSPSHWTGTLKTEAGDKTIFADLSIPTPHSKESWKRLLFPTEAPQRIPAHATARLTPVRTSPAKPAPLPEWGKRNGPEAQNVPVPELQATLSGNVRKMIVVESVPLVEGAMQSQEHGYCVMRQVTPGQDGKVRIHLDECSQRIGLISHSYFVIDPGSGAFCELGSFVGRESISVLGAQIAHLAFDIPLSAFGIDGNLPERELLHRLKSLRFVKTGSISLGRVQHDFTIPAETIALKEIPDRIWKSHPQRHSKAGTQP